MVLGICANAEATSTLHSVTPKLQEPGSHWKTGLGAVLKRTGDSEHGWTIILLYLDDLVNVNFHFH